MGRHLRADPGGTLMMDAAEIDPRLARMDAWLETLRGPEGTQGYGGPVAHWWQQSLLYTGPGYDWRYEGILQGYLTLWQRTKEPRWLAKARRAGDDLAKAQLPGGHYPYSAFEINPASGGTPHEAAADLGLLALARALKDARQPGWEVYLQAAEKNLRSYYIDKLWDPQRRSFRDQPQTDCFVPNKAATACQAFFAWSKITGDATWAEAYALPNLERILAHQVTEPGKLQGAIAQNSFGTSQVPRYMPYYIARCVPGLLEGYQWSGHECYLAAAQRAMDFALHQRGQGGGLLPVVYPKRQVNSWPQWTAALGDVLLAAQLLQQHGLSYDLDEMQQRVLGGQDDSGGVQTARGFTAQAGGKPGSTPDFRDVLHVAGWADKTFRWLAGHSSGAPLPEAPPFRWLAGHSSGAPLPEAPPQTFQATCTFQRAALTFYEDKERVQAVQGEKSVYLWIKGDAWAREAWPAFWLH